MNKKNKVIVGFGMFYIITLLVYLTNIAGDHTALLRTLVYTLAPIIPFIFGILGTRAFGYKNPHGNALLFFTLGIGCWTIGEILWSTYDYILNTDSFPSIADFFYMLAYPLIFIGLIKEVKLGNIVWSQLHKGIIFYIIMSVISLNLIVGYFGVYLAYSWQNTWVENAVSIGYGIGDLVLIFGAQMVLILVWEFRKGKILHPWLYFFLALILTLIADILFAIFTGPYEAKTWPYFQLTDCTWILSYLLFAFSFFNFREIVLEAQQNILTQLRR